MRFDQFLKEICPRLDLEWRKYRRRDARRRVERRMAELGLPDYAAYLEYLLAHRAEARSLPERMRVTVSRFFREYPRWQTLSERVLPRLIADTPKGGTLRMWSAGCCGGEEPYSLAIQWLERFAGSDPPCRAEILATDIDSASLERAGAALYDHSSLREVPGEIKARYFTKTDGRFRLVDEVRNMVRFRRHDLQRDEPPHGFALAVCRYLVFTYYRGERRLEAARNLHRALRPGGALMIARKEDLGAAEGLFASWPGTAGVFRRTS